jgi:hypothetical protein
MKTEMLDLGCCHGHSVGGGHLGEVLRERIIVLLEEEKGSTDGTQLSFINDKGEFLHWGALASKLVFSSYRRMRRKQGNCQEENHLAKGSLLNWSG